MAYPPILVDSFGSSYGGLAGFVTWTNLATGQAWNGSAWAALPVTLAEMIAGATTFTFDVSGIAEVAVPSGIVVPYGWRSWLQAGGSPATGDITSTVSSGEAATNSADSPNDQAAQANAASANAAVTNGASGNEALLAAIQSGSGGTVDANVTEVNGVAFSGFKIPVVVMILPYVNATVPAGNAPALANQNLNSYLNYPFTKPFTINNFDASLWTQAVWTCKTKASDADSAALITIKLTNPGSGGDGLILQNGAAPVSPVTAADGAITVTSATTSGIAFVVNLTARGMGLSGSGTFIYEFTLYSSSAKDTFLGGAQFQVEAVVRQNPVQS